MNKTDKIIAYDLGTGGVKASLYDIGGIACAHIFQQYTTAYTGTDFHEQNPDDWWRSIIQTTRKLLQSAAAAPCEIVGLAISGQSLGAVPIDKEGRLLRRQTPIWSDTRASKQAAQFFKVIDYNNWYLTTGNGFPPACYTIFKIMWYRDHEPEMFQNVFKIMGSKDYCNYRLTGRICTDYSYASGSGVYSLKDHSYMAEYLDAADVAPDLLPDIISSHGLVGTLTPEASELLGLPASVKVICGGVDNSCMALGAMGIKDGRVYTSLGSSSWIAVIGKQPILDIKHKPFVFEHCIQGLYTSATSIFSAGSSLRWVRDVICSELTAAEAAGHIDDAYDVMNDMLKQSPPGANRLIFNPSLAGGAMIEETQHITGGYLGLNLGHTKNDMVRAAMEGITYNLKYAMDILSGCHPGLTRMLLVGGGSKSKVWRQIFADIFNMEITKTTIDQDAASLGAAALAAFGLGYWDDYNRLEEIHIVQDTSTPIEANVTVYSEYYPIQRTAAHYLALLGDELYKLSI